MKIHLNCLKGLPVDKPCAMVQQAGGPSQHWHQLHSSRSGGEVMKARCLTGPIGNMHRECIFSYVLKVLELRGY